MTKPVTVTKPFRAIDPDRSPVHPRLIEAGEVVSGRLAEIAISIDAAAPVAAQSHGAGSAEAAGIAAAAAVSAAPSQPPPPRPRRAKLVKLHVEGDARFAKGAIVEGSEADRLIGLGVAVEIKDQSGPAETR